MDQSNSSQTVPNTSSRNEQKEITSHISPGLVHLAYPLFRKLVLPAYFKQIQVKGQEHLPQQGAVILAPTHRSRWDAILVTYATGRHVTGRDLHFMVSIDEMQGLQGWFIRRLGGFPVNPRKTDLSSLRHSADLLKQEHMLVIFPEGHIVSSEEVQPIELGIAYLALQAETDQPGLDTQIVPISIRYSSSKPHWQNQVEIQIGSPLSVTDYCQKPMKDCAKQLRDDLQTALQTLHQGDRPQNE